MQRNIGRLPACLLPLIFSVLLTGLGAEPAGPQSPKDGRGYLPNIADDEKSPLKDLPPVCPWLVEGSSASQATYDAALLDFIRQETLERYRKSGVRNPKWDDDVEKLYEMLLNVEWFHNYTVPPGSIEIAESIIEKECEDPSACLNALEIMRLHNLDNDEFTFHDQIFQLGRIILSGPGGHYEKIQAAYSAAMALRDMRLNVFQKEEICNELVDAMYGYYVDMLEKNVLPPPYAYTFLHGLFCRFLLSPNYSASDSSGVAARNKFVARLEKENDHFKDRHAALFDFLSGWNNLEHAEHYQGRVPPHLATERNRRFCRQYYDEARFKLMNAFRKDPANVTICEMMIRVCIGRGDGKDAAFRWFKRGVDINFDDPRLYHYYSRLLRPHWGGNHDIQAAFGWECLHSNRFDTMTPFFFCTTIYDIARSTGGRWQAIYRAEKVKKGLKHAYVGSLSSPALAPYRNELLANYAATLLLCGDYEEALRIYQKIDPDKRIQQEFPQTVYMDKKQRYRDARQTPRSWSRSKFHVRQSADTDIAGDESETCRANRHAFRGWSGSVSEFHRGTSVVRGGGIGQRRNIPPFPKAKGRHVSSFQS